MEEKSTGFIFTYQGNQNSSVLSTNEWFTEQLERTQILPIQNVWAAQQILSKIVITFDCILNGETIYLFHCIIYPKKHDGTVLLCMKLIPSS